VTAWRHRYGPWALVTGASDGIGRAVALEAAARGLHVALVARRQAALDAVADDIARAGHGRAARVVVADLATADGQADVVDAVADLDLGLIACCAGFGTSGPFVGTALARELEMLAVNCGAVLHLTHALAPRLVARGRGGVVLMSSLVGFQGVPRAAHYAATKAYVQSLAEGLRHELRPSGVDVVASAPGPVVSGFGAAADMRITSGVLPRTVAVQTLDALGRRATVRPGALSKALEGSLAPLPRAMRVRILARVMAGMTRHQPPPP
jgi:short-subunit dehydrogenase